MKVECCRGYTLCNYAVRGTDVTDEEYTSGIHHFCAMRLPDWIRPLLLVVSELDRIPTNCPLEDWQGPVVPKKEQAATGGYLDKAAVLKAVNEKIINCPDCWCWYQGIIENIQHGEFDATKDGGIECTAAKLIGSCPICPRFFSCPDPEKVTPADKWDKLIGDIKKMGAILAEKDTEIARLKEEVDAAKASFFKEIGINREKSKKILELNDRISHQDQELKDLGKALQEAIKKTVS